MKKGLISVIVPVYNVEKYLDRCIESIVNQTYKDLEIILVDDGSKDNSSKLCDNWSKKDKRIKVIHQQNIGVSSARNKGLDLCKGKYITFVDSDDYIEQDTYDQTISYFNSYNVDIVRFQSIRELKKYKIKSSNSVVGKIEYKENKNQILDLFLKKHEFGSVCGSIFKKSIIGENRFIEDLKFGEDYYFYFNVIFNSSSMYITNKAYYHYVCNNNSATQNFNLNKSKISIENHYRVDLMIYSMIIEKGYTDYKESCLDCTWNITNILLKSIAKNTNFKTYQSFIKELVSKDFYLEYRKKASSYHQKEFKKILSERIFFYYLKFKVEMTIKSIIKKIIGR